MSNSATPIVGSSSIGVTNRPVSSEEGIITLPNGNTSQVSPKTVEDLPNEIWCKILSYLPFVDVLRFARVAKFAQKCSYSVIKDLNYSKEAVKIQPGYFNVEFKVFLERANFNNSQLVQLLQNLPESIEFTREQSRPIPVLPGLSYLPPYTGPAPIQFKLHVKIIEKIFGTRQQMSERSSSLMSPEELDFLLSKLPPLENSLGMGLGLKPEPGYVLSNLTLYLKYASSETLSLLFDFMVEKNVDCFMIIHMFKLCESSEKRKVFLKVLFENPNTTKMMRTFTPNIGTTEIRTLGSLGLFITENGNLNGTGSVKSSDDEIYKGTFKEGRLDGDGTVTDKNGQLRMRGTFKEGVLNGVDVYCRLPDGQIYEGGMKNAEANGNGRLTLPNNAGYKEGLFKDGTFIKGTGEVLFPNGRTYSGEFEKNVPHGKGVVKDDKGHVVYDGLFVDGLSTIGRGMIKYGNGDLYIGEIEYGRAFGKGTYKFENNGDVYSGDFVNDAFHGNGLLKSVDGTVYTGEFKNGKKDGKGSLRTAEGLFLEGTFRNGEFITEPSSQE